MGWWPFRKGSTGTADGRSRTFAVDPVDPVLDAIPAVDAREVWASRGLSTLEGIDRDPQGYVQAEPMHGLLAAVHRAYAEHRPLALAPEDLWLCVLQGLARHVEAHAETLREKFVGHHGKRAVEIHRDELVPGSADNDWASVVQELSEIVRGQCTERARAFLPPPGAGPTAVTACEITMLGALQSYFSLTVHTMCGIPSIRLDGTADEWASLKARTGLLDELGLGPWKRSLDHVLEQCARAANGDVDAKFWREIYKRESASGGDRVSGWINVLFPFLGDRGTERPNRLARFGDHWPKHALEAIGVSEFSAGLSSAPFVWSLLGERIPMSFVAGFTGVTQQPDGVVRARIGWAIAPRAEWKRFSIHSEGELSGLPTLRLRPGERITDCKGIASEAAGLDRWALELPFCQTLTSLDGLQDARGLASFGTLSTDLTTIAPLAGCASLERLWLQQCLKLTDVSALRALPALRTLAINHCDALADLSPVLALEQLQELSLFGKNVPAACVGMHRGPDAVRAALSKLRSCLQR